MVAEQRETVQRIDADTIDIANNVSGAQRELLKYYASISNNRWLMMKVFGVLIVFVSLFSPLASLPRSVPQLIQFCELVADLQFLPCASSSSYLFSCPRRGPIFRFYFGPEHTAVIDMTRKDTLSLLFSHSRSRNILSYFLAAWCFYSLLLMHFMHSGPVSAPLTLQELHLRQSPMV